MPSFSTVLGTLPSRLLRAGLAATLLGVTTLPGAEIVEAEYYLGADPGEGNGTPLSIVEGSDLTALLDEASASLEGLDAGTYDSGGRVQDDEGRWSKPIIRRCTYTPRDLERAGGRDPDGPANHGVEAFL